LTVAPQRRKPGSRVISRAREESRGRSGATVRFSALGRWGMRAAICRPARGASPVLEAIVAWHHRRLAVAGHDLTRLCGTSP
jgi:hypothetical protein